LHLWSLGIEEQFYIIWPFTLWCAWRFRLNLLSVTLLGVIISFSMNLLHIDAGGVAIFYSPQTRFWELLAGAALANALLYRGDSLPKSLLKFSESIAPSILGPAAAIDAKLLGGLACLCGGAMVATGIFAISAENAYPGYWALLPTVGACLIISSGPSAWLNRFVLSNKVMVWFGLISYPLYLWHWPLLSFATITGASPPPPLERLAIVGLSVALAWLTYIFVERPIRFGGHRNLTTLVLCLLTTSIAVVGYETYRHDGFRFRAAEMRQSAAQRQWFEADSDCIKKLGLTEGLTLPSVFCSMTQTNDPIKVALLGDSTANHLYPGMSRLFKGMHTGVINLGRSTCAPFNNLIYEAEHDDDCTIINRRIYDYIDNDPDIRVIILAFAAWDLRNMTFHGKTASTLTLDEKFSLMADQINRDIKRLAKPNRQLIATFDAPRLDVDIAVCVRNPRDPKCNPKKSDHDSQWGPYITAYRNIFSQHKDVCIFSQENVLISDQNTYQIFIDGKLTFRDPYHYTIYGSNRVADALSQSSCFDATRSVLTSHVP
jgi:peptidoglycan/LPS O-acetylase OafA/YrhL